MESKREIRSFASPAANVDVFAFEMQKDQEGQCVFLKDAQCSVYKVRPLICRFYPFELSTDEKGVCTFRVTEECPGVSFDDAVGLGKKLDASYFRALFELARTELNRSSS